MIAAQFLSNSSSYDEWASNIGIGSTGEYEMRLFAENVVADKFAEKKSDEDIDSDEDFEKLLKTVFAFFEEHKNGVFHETRVFRGMDNIPLNKDDRAAFTRLLNLFKLVANPQSRKIALKQVDLNASLQYSVTEQGKNRLMSFFNQ